MNEQEYDYVSTNVYPLLESGRTFCLSSAHEVIENIEPPFAQPPCSTYPRLLLTPVS